MDNKTMLKDKKGAGLIQGLVMGIAGLVLKDKKGAGLIQGLVMGIAGLVIAVILAFVIVSTLNNASLLTSGSAEQNATTQLISNFTTGVNNVSNKIPTVLLIAAVVLILGVLVMLWAQYKRMQVGGNAEI